MFKQMAKKRIILSSSKSLLKWTYACYCVYSIQRFITPIPSIEDNKVVLCLFVFKFMPLTIKLIYVVLVTKGR